MMKSICLLSLFVFCGACHAADSTSQISPSGDYSARARVADGGDSPSIRFRVIVTLTIELSTRDIVFWTDVQGADKWVMLWHPSKDCLIFYAPNSEYSSEAYEPKAKYGPFTTRKLTEEELAMAKHALAEIYLKQPNSEGRVTR